VAELLPAVVRWARGPLAEIFEGSLSDRRVIISEGDVRDLIEFPASTYDAILLDVDNGPEGLTRKSNDRLYDLEGLRAARAALTPGGILAVWSSASSKRFTARLHEAGFRVEQVKIRTTGDRGASNTVWIATSGEAAVTGQNYGHFSKVANKRRPPRFAESF
jgi:spermidine synthase